MVVDFRILVPEARLGCVQISERQLAMASALGAGLLVGTALAVIIPEGFHAFQAAEHESGGPCNIKGKRCPAAACHVHTWQASR